ncbi:MAG: D-2-hydroxyacid dehydrogenase [Eubacteriales bacterium]
MKIVMLDRNTLGLDIDVSIFQQLGEFSSYHVLPREKAIEKIRDADIIIFNKTVIDEEFLRDAHQVKLLCVTATGTDNIDLDYIQKRGILLSNIRGYSTPAVVQHTFALALYVMEKLAYYDEYVKSGTYSNQLGFSNFDERYSEIQGKTWGIVGMGNIGQGVAKVVEAFGGNVIFYSASGENTISTYKRVIWEELLEQSDIISIHCPLTERTRQLFNQQAFGRMKNTAILVNVARGGVVNDQDLYDALEDGVIAGAGLDVIGVEPMEKSNPLSKIQDSKRLIITPHMAWASVESRNRCVQEVFQNIKDYLEGRPRNAV